ncbi:unnamed protein product, partial [Coregonus sp. 'balchen']
FRPNDSSDKQITFACCRPRHGSKLARRSMTSSRDMLDPMSTQNTAAWVCVANEGIKWVKTSAESPDLNPI